MTLWLVYLIGALLALVDSLGGKSALSSVYLVGEALVMFCTLVMWTAVSVLFFHVYLAKSRDPFELVRSFRRIVSIFTLTENSFHCLLGPWRIALGPWRPLWLYCLVGGEAPVNVILGVLLVSNRLPPFAEAALAKVSGHVAGANAWLAPFATVISAAAGMSLDAALKTLMWESMEASFVMAPEQVENLLQAFEECRLRIDHGGGANRRGCKVEPTSRTSKAATAAAPASRPPIVDWYVVHSPDDDPVAKAEALAKRARHFEMEHGRLPRVWVDGVECASGSVLRGRPRNRIDLALMPIRLSRSSRAVLLYGGNFLSRLHCGVHIFMWLNLGGSLEGIDVVPVRSDNDPSRAKLIAEVDTFHVLKTSEVSQDSRTLVQIVLLAGMFRFNREVSSIEPLVREAFTS